MLIAAAQQAQHPYASQWEKHRKVSVSRLEHLQPEGSKTLSFYVSTFPDTAHSHWHMPAAVKDLQWSIKHNADCREVVAGYEYICELENGSIEETALYHVILKVSSISSWLVPHPLSADDKPPLTGPILTGPDVCEHTIGTTAWQQCFL